jgi:pseudouridine synthase
MADAGVAARRVCEQLIEDGRVEVNDEVVTRLPIFVDPFKDRITVDGRELARARRSSAGKGAARAEMVKPVYVLLNKPARVLTAASDPTGRVTVNELVKYPTPVRLIPVGRLEWEATGLVLLTNDGDLVNRLTHPSYGVDRVFEVQVKGVIDPAFLADLEKGINLKAQRAAREAGRRHAPIALQRAARPSGPGDDRALAKTSLQATVKPGATVKLADLLSEAGVKVAGVKQVALGPLKLVDVKPGLWRDLERHEVAALKKVTGGGSTRNGGEGGRGEGSRHNG